MSKLKTVGKVIAGLTALVGTAFAVKALIAAFDTDVSVLPEDTTLFEEIPEGDDVDNDPKVK